MRLRFSTQLATFWGPHAGAWKYKSWYTDNTLQQFSQTIRPKAIKSPIGTTATYRFLFLDNSGGGCEELYDAYALRILHALHTIVAGRVTYSEALASMGAETNPLKPSVKLPVTALQVMACT